MQWLLKQVKQNEIDKLSNNRGRSLSEEEVMNALIRKQMRQPSSGLDQS